jgi:hypothetical protein
MALSVAAKSVVSWTLAPAMAAPSGPPSASTTRRRFTPFSPIRRVATHEVTPHAGFAHGGVGRFPRPAHPAHRVTGLDQQGPDASPNATSAPPLEMAMHRAVVPKAHRELIPLAVGMQTEDDAIQGKLEIHTPMSLGLRRIIFVQSRLDERPAVKGAEPGTRPASATVRAPR